MNKKQDTYTQVHVTTTKKGHWLHHEDIFTYAKCTDAKFLKLTEHTNLNMSKCDMLVCDIASRDDYLACVLQVGSYVCSSGLKQRLECVDSVQEECLANIGLIFCGWPLLQICMSKVVAGKLSTTFK